MMPELHETRLRQRRAFVIAVLAADAAAADAAKLAGALRIAATAAFEPLWADRADNAAFDAAVAAPASDTVGGYLFHANAAIAAAKIAAAAAAAFAAVLCAASDAHLKTFEDEEERLSEKQGVGT